MYIYIIRGSTSKQIVSISKNFIFKSLVSSSTLKKNKGLGGKAESSMTNKTKISWFNVR